MNVSVVMTTYNGEKYLVEQLIALGSKALQLMRYFSLTIDP